jgi:hypothetical protein
MPCVQIAIWIWKGLNRMHICEGVQKVLGEEVSPQFYTPYLDEVEVKLRPTVSWPVCLGVRRPSGTCDQFFFLLEIFFRQLQVCYSVMSSLTRGRVCSLLLLLVLASAVPRDSRPYFIVPILETPPTWRARSLYLYPLGTGWPSYTLGTGFPFRRLSQLAGLWWRCSNPPPHGEEWDLSTISYIGIQFVPHRNHITSF